MKKVNANDKIIEAYWKLANGNKLTISSICKEAKINRSTFYQYYLDIYELSNNEENRIIDELITRINNEFPNDIPNDIESFTKVVIDIFGNYSDYLNIILNNNSANFQRKLTNELSKRVNIVLNIDPKNPYFKYVITYLISNICSLLKCWFDNERDLSFEELATLIHGLVFNGILNNKEK